jgi:Spy/CpxP family protein refolding chaperone
MTRTKLWMSVLAAACLAATTSGRAKADAPDDPSPIVQPEGGESDEGIVWNDDDLDPPIAFQDGAHGAGGPGHGMRMRGGPGAWGRGRGLGLALRDLDLTETQRKKLAEIRDAQTRAGIQARANLQIAQLDLTKLIRADKPDKRAIDAQIDRIGTMRSSLQKSRVAALLEARSVLTPEQQQQLRERREHGRSNHSDRPEGGQ